MPIWYRIDPVWENKPVVLIGGGLSVTAATIKQIALARLNNLCRVIAINDAVYLAWWADWLHAADLKWWQGHVQTVPRFDGIKTTIDELVPVAWVTGALRVTGVDGFDPDPAGCRTGNGSGYQALHCAIHTGTPRIVLVGFDMLGSHWSGVPADTNYLETMVPHFSTLLPILQERGIDVVNVSNHSLLSAFRRDTLDKALVCP